MSSGAPAVVVALVSANAPYWGAEAEIVQAYFDAPGRSAHTDEAWLLGQCHKELVDGVVHRLVDMQLAPDTEPLDETTRTEIAHFLAFAAAWRACRDDDRLLTVADVFGANWDENDALAALRRRQCEEHGQLGALAKAFTEGGYCTLYSVGAALTGAEPRDRAIAHACRVAYDDEWDHMFASIERIAAAGLTTADTDHLIELTTAQGRLRLRMRNAQFGRPLGAGRMAELEAGGGAPIGFDFARAGFE